MFEVDQPDAVCDLGVIWTTMSGTLFRLNKNLTRETIISRSFPAPDEAAAAFQYRYAASKRRNADGPDYAINEAKVLARIGESENV
jgi:hypothetical protein